MNTANKPIYIAQKINLMRKEINLPREIMQCLQQRADNEGRSLKNYIEQLCRDHVRAEIEQRKQKRKMKANA